MADVDLDLFDETDLAGEAYLQARGLLPGRPDTCGMSVPSDDGGGVTSTALFIYEGALRRFAESMSETERANADIRQRYYHTGHRLDSARAALDWLRETHAFDELALRVIEHALYEGGGDR